jgi:predicted enzyme related to lactoylglutathione lyase
MKAITARRHADACSGATASAARSATPDHPLRALAPARPRGQNARVPTPFTRPARLACRAAVLTLALAASPVRMNAQAPTLPYDHMHLAAPNRNQAIEWYKAHLGAARHELGDRVSFGPVTFSWFERAASPSSDGSVIDHIAFSVADVRAAAAEITQAGGQLLAPPQDRPGAGLVAFVTDPWGVKLELLQDAERPGFHHMHLRLPDPARALAWFRTRFGGEPGRFRDTDGLRYAGLWLLVDRVEGAPKSEGRAIDHLGWRVRDLDTEIAGAKTRGDAITMTPRMIRDVKVGVIEDPNGVRIELAQRPVF